MVMNNKFSAYLSKSMMQLLAPLLCLFGQIFDLCIGILTTEQSRGASQCSARGPEKLFIRRVIILSNPIKNIALINLLYFFSYFHSSNPAITNIRAETNGIKLTAGHCTQAYIRYKTTKVFAFQLTLASTISKRRQGTRQELRFSQESAVNSVL